MLGSDSLLFVPALPASTMNPSMDGAPTAGALLGYSRGDHRHPSDTSRMPLAGTTTNDNAGTGNVGEFMSRQVLSTSPLPLTTATSAVITTLSLTAGDWDVWGAVGFTLAGVSATVTLRGWINQGGSTAPSLDQMGGNTQRNLQGVNNATSLMPVTPLRVSLATGLAISVGAIATFSGGTVTAFGQIMARRVR